MQIEAAFPVRGVTLPIDHHYLLYAALARGIPAFHDAKTAIHFAPITGSRSGPALLGLDERSCLRVRLSAEQIALVLPLAGRALEIGDHRVHLAPPTVRSLLPAPQLFARVVTYKNAVDLDRFLAMTRGRLAELGIRGDAAIPVIGSGPRAGEPVRRVVRIKGRTVIGYALYVSGLLAEESVLLQERGLGGRTRMGCGFFVPVQPRA